MLAVLLAALSLDSIKALALSALVSEWPVLAAFALVVVVLLVAKKNAKVAAGIEAAATFAYNSVEAMKINGKLSPALNKADVALGIFKTEMAKKNLTVTDAAIDMAKAIWADLHVSAIATGTHQDAPAK